MIGALRAHLTYANVMATAAVFIALGGSAAALSTNQVESRHIDNGTVQSEDVKNDDLTGADIDESTLDVFLETELEGGAPGWLGPNSSFGYCDKGWDATGGGGVVEPPSSGALSASTWTNVAIPAGKSPGWGINSTSGPSSLTLVCARIGTD